MTRSKLTISLIAGVLLSVLGIWIAGGMLVSPAHVSMPAMPGGAAAVSFDSASGSKLQGWFFATQGAAASVVLMHGVRGNRTDMTQRAALFQSMGMSVLTFDFQAHGESPGEFITFGARESLDAVAAVAFARAQAPGLPVVVVGFSLGGASSLLAGSALEADVLVVESVYSDIEQAAANRLNKRIPSSGVLSPLLLWQLGPRLGVDPADLSPVSAAAKVEIPTLVMSGSDDRHTLLWETEAIYAAIPVSKRLHIFAGAGHQDLERYDPNGYRNVLMDFICETIELPACEPSQDAGFKRHH